MGVACQINLEKTQDDVYRPGENIKGMIKYILTKDTVFASATLSLKGYGYCEWSNTEPKSLSSAYTHASFTGNEKYVSYEINLLSDSSGIVAAGEYTAPFNFALPLNIPSSVSYMTWSKEAIILYYLRIKFVEAGFLGSTKKFRRVINIVSPVVRTMQPGPMSCDIKKSIKKLFSAEVDEINLKATVDDTLIAPGKNINIKFDIENKSKIDVPAIKVKILRHVTLRDDYGRVKFFDKELEESTVKTDLVISKTIKSINTIVQVPANALTVQYSKIISWDYILRIVLKVTGFYSDAVLDIPIVIGNEQTNNSFTYLSKEMPAPEQPPPSYWEAMEEHKTKE